MFGRIARRYDVANRLLSGGMDVGWRKRLVEAVARHSPARVLDLATGSGDVALALSQRLSAETEVVGMDFCEPMLEQARAKQQAKPDQFRNVTFARGDGLDLPLENEQFDAVTIAFGLRNLKDRDRGLREMRRVLRPNGRLYVLEFSQPDRWCRGAYRFYLSHVLPRFAGLVTGDRDAYQYLNETVAAFPDRFALADEISRAGFAEVRATPLTFGTVALHEAVR